MTLEENVTTFASVFFPCPLLSIDKITTLTQLHIVCTLVFVVHKKLLGNKGKRWAYYVVDDFDVRVFSSEKPNTAVCTKRVRRTFGEQKNICNSSFLWREREA